MLLVLVVVPIFSTYSQRGLHHTQTRSRLYSQPTPEGDCIIYQHVHAYILNLLPKGIASYTKTFTPIISTYFHHIQNIHAYILNLLPKGIAYTNNVKLPNSASPDNDHTIENVCRLLHITIFISRITLLIGDDTPNKTMLWLKSLLEHFK